MVFDNPSLYFVPADSHVPVILHALPLLEGRTLGSADRGLAGATAPNLSLRIEVPSKASLEKVQSNSLLLLQNEITGTFV